MNVVVVGAGMGGLSCAIGLASRGARVTLLEQNENVGGKLDTWSSKGWTFDTGPHVLTMKWAIEEVFAQAGAVMEAMVEIVPLPTVCRYHFCNGDTLDMSANVSEAAQAIGRFAPGDEAGFEKFLRYAAQVTNATVEPFLKQDFGARVKVIPTWQQWRQLVEFARLRPWRSLRQVVHSCFTDERLRSIFELYALYSGSHPARTSAIFATVADVQWHGGTFYVKGGLYELARAMRRVAEGLGVQIRCSTAAAQILVKHGKARGVILENGERLYADTVVIGADCLRAIPALVPLEAQRRWNARRINKIEPSTSAFLLLLGIDGQYEALSHHNSFLSGNPAGEYADIFDNGVPSSDPTVGVACQSVTDPGKAPAGCSNLFIMTNPPALGDNWDWDKEAPAYRRLVLEKLERMGLTGLRQRIRVEQMRTPKDLQDRYGAYKGAIYGLSSNGWRQAFLRPPNISPDVSGLYYVGGSTHPGGGLPLCALSGSTVAREIMERERATGLSAW